ncbi:MAG: sulfotransferase, partial [Deltaproteobacteria bacterium]
MSAPLKLINLGLPKSGTTTLAEALTKAGMRVADWKVRVGKAKVPCFVGQLMYQSYFETGDPLELLDKFDAFTEIDIVMRGFNLWPQFDWGLLSAIRAHHPGARFLLTTRDPAKQSDSMHRWTNLGTHRLPTNAIPGLPEGYGGTHAQRIRWIEGHVAFCRKIFGADKDFLELSIEDPDAKAKLEDFSGISLPWWGIANANTRRLAEEEQHELDELERLEHI